MALSVGSSPQATPTTSYKAEFQRTWQQRLSQAQAAGFDPKKLTPIIQADWRRVQQGSSPYNNTQAALAVHSFLGPNALIRIKDRPEGDGILGSLVNAVKNVPADIGQIASGLNPLTLVPALYEQGERAVTHPEQIIKPLETLASGNLTGALKQASKAPLLSLVPGVYTAKNLVTGNLDEIIKHPVMTGLDVLPYASSAGKLAMAGRAVEGSAEAAALESAGKLRGTVEPQSPAAALLEGKPLKAGFRAAGGTTDSPLSYRWTRATQGAKAATSEVMAAAKAAGASDDELARIAEAAKLPKVYRSSDVTARIAEKYGFDYETRELNRLHNILRRKEGEAGLAASKNYNEWFKDLSDDDRVTVLNAAQRFNPDGLNAAMGEKFTPAMRDVIEQARAHVDELAEPYIYNPWEEATQRNQHAESGSTDEFSPTGTAVREDKRFIAIPNDGGSVDVYPIDGDVGRAYQKVFEKERQIAPRDAAFEAAKAKYSEAELRAGETGEPIPEAVIRAHDRALTKFDAAHKELQKAQDLYDKIHDRAAPARYGELLKDEFKGRLRKRVRQLSEDNVHVVYRRSADSLEKSLAHPQGAGFGFNPDDFEYNRTNLVMGNADHEALFGSKLRPQNPLHAQAKPFEGIGQAALRAMNVPADLAERIRTAFNNDMSASWNEGFDLAERELGIKIKPEDRAALAQTADTSLGIDAVAAEYARKTGHDAIIRYVSEGDPVNPVWKPYEVTALKKEAFQAAQKEPVLTAEQAGKAAEAITNNNFGYLVDEGIITSNQLKAVMGDVMNNWQELARQGYDPVYVPHVPESKVPYLLDQKPLAGNLYTPRQFLSKDSLSFAPQAQDMAIALTSYAKEILKQNSSLEMFKAVKSMATTQKQLVERFGLERATKMLADDYIPYSETSGRYLSKPQMELLPDSEKLYIPRILNTNLDHMMNAFDRHPAFGLYDKAMKAYKFGILTGPRHVAHVLFGGMAMMMGEHGITAFPKFYEALKMVRNGEIPTTLSRGLDYFTPEEWATMAQGKTMGRMMVKAAGSPFRALAKFEEHIANTQRVMTYLREMEKGAKAGLDTTAAEAAAMKLTNKVYMDIDGMAPLERTVLRHVFPFYTFTKHIIRYALNYPADHPWRAATLANIARIEEQDHASGLPSQFNDFLFLGDLDKDGNQSAIDVKNFNPFRSLDGQNPLTLAGFMSALSPAFTIPASLAGINTLTATPDLYPDLDYDPRTGKLVATHPDIAQKALALGFPPAGALEAVLGLTEDWRQLRKSDPDAYNRALMSSMNLPFVPQKRNLGLERGKAEANRYRTAQGALSDAFRSGDTSELSRFNVLPFQGNLIKSNVMIQLIENIKKQYPGIAPGSVVPRSHGKGSLGAALATVK